MPNETADKPQALAIREDRPVQLVVGENKPLRYTLSELKEIAGAMVASGMFKDLRTVQQAMVKILAGSELGYGPFQSLRAFHTIDGKPVETSGEISARIKRSGRYRMESWFIGANGEKLDPVRAKAADTHGCVVQIHEKVDGEWFTLEPVVFTKDDAQTAGLLGKDVWKKYLRNMLFSRALTNAARFHCADIFGGPIYTPEELGAEVVIDSEGGEIIDAAHTPLPPDPAPPQPAADARLKALRRDAHILKEKKGLSDNAYRTLIYDEFGRASLLPDPKTGEEHPTSLALDVAGLQRLVEKLSAA